MKIRLAAASPNQMRPADIADDVTEYDRGSIGKHLRGDCNHPAEGNARYMTRNEVTRDFTDES